MNFGGFFARNDKGGEGGSGGSSIFAASGRLFETVTSKTGNLVSDITQKVDLASKLDTLKKRTSIDILGQTIMGSSGTSNEPPTRSQRPPPPPPKPPSHESFAQQPSVEHFQSPHLQAQTSMTFKADDTSSPQKELTPDLSGSTTGVSFQDDRDKSKPSAPASQHGLGFPQTSKDDECVNSAPRPQLGFSQPTKESFEQMFKSAAQPQTYVDEFASAQESYNWKPTFEEASVVHQNPFNVNTKASFDAKMSETKIFNAPSQQMMRQNTASSVSRPPRPPPPRSGSLSMSFEEPSSSSLKAKPPAEIPPPPAPIPEPQTNETRKDEQEDFEPLSKNSSTGEIGYLTRLQCQEIVSAVDNMIADAIEEAPGCDESLQRRISFGTQPQQSLNSSHHTGELLRHTQRSFESSVTQPGLGVSLKNEDVHPPTPEISTFQSDVRHPSFEENRGPSVQNEHSLGSFADDKAPEFDAGRKDPIGGYAYRVEEEEELEEEEEEEEGEEEEDEKESYLEEEEEEDRERGLTVEFSQTVGSNENELKSFLTEYVHGLIAGIWRAGHSGSENSHGLVRIAVHRSTTENSHGTAPAKAALEVDGFASGEMVKVGKIGESDVEDKNEPFKEKIFTPQGREIFSKAMEIEGVRSGGLLKENGLRMVLSRVVFVLTECQKCEDFVPAKRLLTTSLIFHIEDPMKEGERVFLFSYIKSQPIWHSLRFWNACFFQSVQETRAKLLDQGKSDAEIDTAIIDHIKSYLNTMQVFNLHATMREEFLRKQGDLFNLRQDTIESLFMAIEVESAD